MHVIWTVVLSVLKLSFSTTLFNFLYFLVIGKHSLWEKAVLWFTAHYSTLQSSILLLHEGVLFHSSTGLLHISWKRLWKSLLLVYSMFTFSCHACVQGSTGGCRCWCNQLFGVFGQLHPFRWTKQKGYCLALYIRLHTYVYFTTKVDMTENIKYSIKYKNKMQTTDY